MKYLFILSLFIGHQSLADQGNWKAEMYTALHNYLIVYDELSKDKKDIDKKRVQKAFEELTTFKQKTLSAKSSYLSKKDPLISNSFDLIESRFKKASDLFNVDNITGSKRFLSASIAQCVACHRHGGSNTAMGKLIDNFNFERPVFKARLLVAMRDYKSAKKSYENILNSEQFDNKYSVNQIIGEYTSVLLSWNTSSQLSKRLSPLTRMRTKNIDHSTIKKIKDFIAKYNKRVDLNNTFSKLGFADDIMNSYEDPQLMFTQKFEFLKSLLTYIYHSEMKNIDNKIIKAKAYYTLGKIYSHGSLMDNFLLPETYFEKCVRVYPYSSSAKQCYNELKTYVTLGWTGSSGTRIPVEEKKRLRDLKKLIKK